MTTRKKQSVWITVAGLTLLVFLGGYLRLKHLEERSVTHVEMYVPGIRLPQGISIPVERLGLLKVVTSTLNSDTHPPAYYVMTWAWVKCFGVSTESIRLPSALLGIACIPLVFWLGVLTEQTAAGWIAAALLAVNGHHVFWSQIARMFTLACFLGLLATILLLMLATKDPAPRSLGYLYTLVVLVGLATHIFFWLVLGAHVVWTFLNAWSRRREMPGSLKLEISTLILGSPLLAFAAYQNGNTLATLSRSGLIYAREFLQFAFAFPLVGYSSGVNSATSRGILVDDPHLSLWRWLFVALSLLLFAVGVGSTCKVDANENLLSDSQGPSRRMWLLAGGLGTLAILAFIVTARRFAHPPNPTLRATETMIVLPFLLVLIAVVLQKYWVTVTAWRISVLDSGLLAGKQALVLMLAVLPLVMLAIISADKPIFAARGMLLLAPYVLLVLAWGIVRLSRNRFVALALLLAIGFAHYKGLQEYDRMSAGRADYKQFAAVLAPNLQKTDLVFLHPEFYSTPLFFYVQSGWNQFVGQNYEAACRENPHARVWALWFYNYEDTIPPSIEKALAGYLVVQTIDAPGGQALLYAPKEY
jgi:4-amino-4-deoxy-L-arabinose transferase-like glycosyltransferase